MEQKTLLAQLKAFQTYLKNYIEAAKSRPQNEVNEESKQFTEEKDADKSELNYIDSRYSRLREHIETKYLDIFKGLPYDMNTNIIGVEHIHREIGFVLDTIANLEAFDANQSNNQPSFKSNNQPFTKDEIQIINNQLDDLQNKLLETIHKEEITPERAIPFY